jgi:conjugative coupling factor TraD (TOL family)
MSRYPIEAWLRPPVEFWSALVAGLAAVIALFAPWALMMTPDVAVGAAGLLAWLALVRARQGWRVWRYQRHLRRLPTYRLPADRIPVSHHKLFLGRGFRWTQTHTQRLADTLRPQVQRYVEPPALYTWARRLETQWEHTPGLRWVAEGLAHQAWWNPLAPRPPLGGKAVLHGVEPHEHAVWMPLRERVGHTLVLGTTRVGKTRLAEVLITQDIHRGDVVIVFDPKGDADLFRRMWAEARRAGRAPHFYFFHLGYPKLSARYNAIGDFERITEVATRITHPLPSQGNSAAFREFAWRFANIVARAVVALGRRPDYHQIRQHITDIEPLFMEYAHHYLTRHGPADWPRAVTALAGQLNERTLPLAFRGRQPQAIALYQYLQQNSIHHPVLDGLISAFKYDRTYFDKLVSSVGPLMEKLTSGQLAELIAPDYFDVNDPRPIFDWEQVIRQQAIVYVGLDALSDTTVASAVGNAMFADLASVAGRLYKHGREAGLPEIGETGEAPAISMHADEFNELIGEEFIPLLNKAGGAGFQVTAYTQTWSDIEARVGNRALAGQVAGNLNTLIVLRVLDPVTAKMLTDKLPEVEINALMQVTGATDSSVPGSDVEFTSSNQDRIAVQRVAMLAPSDLIALPKGQAFALLEGGHLWKLRLPWPDTRYDPRLPPTLAAAAEEMAAQYRTGERWWVMPADSRWTPQAGQAMAAALGGAAEPAPKAGAHG